MKRNIIKLLLISCILSGCKKSNTSQGEFQIVDLIDDEFSEISADSIYLLIPSQACFECTKNSIQLMGLFGNKQNCSIVIFGNSDSRGFKILFKSELSKYSNIVVNQIDKWESYVGDDPFSIWVVFSLRENNLRYKVRLTEENIPLLKSIINKLDL